MHGSTEMATISYFVDKLSAEIRTNIYGFLFGESAYVKRPTPNDAEARSATAILATCRKIHEEALETLYNTKTVRLTVRLMWAQCTLLRSVAKVSRCDMEQQGCQLHCTDERIDPRT